MKSPSSEADYILYPEFFDRLPVVGQHYKVPLNERAAEVDVATEGAQDPNVTVLIRTRNHAERIAGIFEDIHRQAFKGEVQVVVVDTESSDGTQEIARSHGATVRSIAQHDFNYANSLNTGFDAADHPYVLTLVGHSRLSNTQTLHGVTRWATAPSFGGAYGAALPDGNATLGDVAISLLQKNTARLKPAEKLDEWHSGAMVAHRSVVARGAWEELGGYDESYGNGGEDTDMARRMIAGGMSVVREPVLSVHHSYGLNILDTARHIRKLRNLRTAQPESFEQGSVRHLNDPQQPGIPEQ